jgi:hypothetical protein
MFDGGIVGEASGSYGPHYFILNAHTYIGGGMGRLNLCFIHHRNESCRTHRVMFKRLRNSLGIILF